MDKHRDIRDILDYGLEENYTIPLNKSNRVKSEPFGTTDMIKKGALIIKENGMFVSASEYEVGALTRDANGDLYVCLSDGTNKSWSKKSGGISSVSHDTTLIGDGTSVTPLGVSSLVELKANKNVNGGYVGIDADGKVGIGVATPTYPLEIGGDINGVFLRIGQTNGNDVNPIFRFSGDSSTGTNRNVDLQLDAENGVFNIFTPSTVAPTVKAVSVNSSGNVGIGTANPAGKLDVRGSSAPVLNMQRDLGIPANTVLYNCSQMKLTSTVPINNNGIGFYFYGQNSNLEEKQMGLFGGRLSSVASGGEVGEIIFQSAWRGAEAGQTPHLIIKATGETTGNVLIPNGNVGIGTANPLSILETAGISPVITIRDTQEKSWALNDLQGKLSFRTSDTSGIGKREIASISVFDDVGGSATPRTAMSFSVQAGTVATEAMRISSAGRVGIGTVAPVQKLDVKDVASTSIRISTGRNSASDYGQLEFWWEGNPHAMIRSNASGNTSNISFWVRDGDVSAVEKMRILTNGNVGIGTSTPSEKLEVTGNIKASGQIISSAATGTAPLFVASTTKVNNLNTDKLDDYELSDIFKQTLSKGQNLVTNGFALMQNNTNFSTLIYDGANAKETGGSFKKTGNASNFAQDEFMPVNVNETYEISFYAKSKLGTGTYYFYVRSFDIDGNAIMARHCSVRPNTLTTLSQDLNNGDTVLHLTSCANWDNTSSEGYMRHLLFWDYANSKRYIYPPNTYTRNSYYDMYDIGAVDFVNNTITLKTAWDKGTRPAGTSISNGNGGDSYSYLMLNNTALPISWTKYTCNISGLCDLGVYVAGKFPNGTAQVKLAFLTNYNSSIGEEAWFTALEFGIKYARVNGIMQTNLNADMLDGIHASGFTTANQAISGATKTKITYDTKGLVISGADATTADITDSTNKRYVTDAEKTAITHSNRTVLDNVSGVNTGDETGARIAGIINNSTAQSTFLDTDKLPISKNGVSQLNYITIANVKKELIGIIDGGTA